MLWINEVRGQGKDLGRKLWVWNWGAKNQRQEREYVVNRQLWAKADFFHTCEYIHIQLANSNIVKTSDLSRKKLSGSGKWGGSEILDWWDYRRNRISFNFVCSFLSARGPRPSSRWFPVTNLLTGIPREIQTGVPWESRRELAKIPAYTPEGNDIKELFFFVS